MSTADNLMGVGIQAEAARRIGVIMSNVTAASTSQAAGTAILAGQTAVNVTAAGGATAVVLPANAEYYRMYYIYNSSGTTAVVFPSTGYAINATAADSSVNLATLQTRVFFRVGALQWASMITS